MTLEPFSSFMSRALFDPQRGYYTKQIAGIGRRGDFSTSATLLPDLAKAIASWIGKEYRKQPQVRQVIEVGGGDGTLMQLVRKALGWNLSWRFRYHIVDVSETLRLQQRHRLGDRVQYHQTMEQALAATGGDAWIYHNELLDAFPATLIEWRGGQWHEVWVPEELRPLEIDPQPFSALKHTTFAEGQRCEIHPSIREWLQKWSPHWKRGQMLTIDYGDEFPALYHRRPGGTLRGYLMHQRLYWPDLLQSPGRMDLTADINFTDYRAWCHELGFEELSYQTMAQWSGYGEADGAGEAFKCVIHRRAD